MTIAALKKLSLDMMLLEIPKKIKSNFKLTLGLIKSFYLLSFIIGFIVKHYTSRYFPPCSSLDRSLIA